MLPLKIVTLKCGDKQKHSLKRKDLKVNLNALEEPNTLFIFATINYINFEAIVRCVPDVPNSQLAYYQFVSTETEKYVHF